MPIGRMDSCGGLIISPQDLCKFANQITLATIEQRGSLDGSECLLKKEGPWTFVAMCNKRKSYEFKLPLLAVFKKLRRSFTNENSSDEDDQLEPQSTQHPEPLATKDCTPSSL